MSESCFFIVLFYQGVRLEVRKWEPVVLEIKEGEMVSSSSDSHEPTVPVVTRELKESISIVTQELGRESQEGLLSVVIDQRVQAVFPNPDGNYEYQTQFGNDESVEILVPGVALGIEAGQAVIIAITQQEPLRGILPSHQYQAEMHTQYMYDVRAFLQDGTEVVHFNKAIELVIATTAELQATNNVSVYFVNEETKEWQRIDEVNFETFGARFLVDHLTIFAIWETVGISETMRFDSGFVNCYLWLNTVPWCAPWVWGYGGLVLLVATAVGRRLIYRRKRR